MDNNFSNILDIFKKLDETGPEFTGYWKGTDAGTPGKKMVGASESIEQECEQPMTLADRLRARWEETKKQKGLQEYGMTTGGTVAPTGGTAAPAKPDPQDVTKTQQAVNKLKSAGANIPNVNQAVQAAMKDPIKDPQSAQDKKIAGGLGQEIEQLLAKGDPSSINQLASIIQKNKQQGE